MSCEEVRHLAEHRLLGILLPGKVPAVADDALHAHWVEPVLERRAETRMMDSPARRGANGQRLVRLGMEEDERRVIGRGVGDRRLLIKRVGSERVALTILEAVERRQRGVLVRPAAELPRDHRPR